VAETEDSVLPILRRIQTDLADLKRETRDGFSELRGSIRDLSERMDSFEGYFTYQMGLTSRNQMDIKKIQSDMRTLTARIDKLEPS